MNKQILLGLLLVPCVTHTMDENEVHNQQGIRGAIYSQQLSNGKWRMATLNEETGTYATMYNGNGWREDVLDPEAPQVFAELKTTYEKQQKEKEEKDRILRANIAYMFRNSGKTDSRQ